MADDEREERLLYAVNFALNRISNENIVKLAQNALSLSGEEIVEALEIDEGIAFAAPADVIVDGKGEPGMVIVCENRVMLNWSTGIRKPQAHIESMPIDDDLHVTKELKKLGILKGWRSLMRMDGAHSWEFHVFDEKSGVLGNFVEGFATGAMVPKFSD